MKKIILYLLLLISIVSKSQTGITSYPLPTGTTPVRYSLEIDASGNKWVGFRKDGLGKYNGSTWTVYDTLTSNIPSNRVNKIAFDNSGNIWVATNKGLGKFDGITWTTYNIFNSGLPHDSVEYVTTDNADIWIGTRNGLAKLNGSTWTIYNTSNSGLNNNRIQCIAVDQLHDVYVGTKTGLFKKSGSTWTNFNSTNPYLVNTYDIRCIYVDASNEKWCGSLGTQGNGAYKVVGAELKPLWHIYSNYSFYSGYAPYSFVQGSHGGVAFYGLTNLGYPGLTEITSSQVYHYSNAGSDLNVYDSSSGLIWYLRQIGTPNTIYSFNPSTFSGTNIIPPLPPSQLTHLDINMVDANIYNEGNSTASGYYMGYEVPKNSNRHPIFATDLWIGGIDNGGSLHVAAMTYRQTGIDFWPGPLDTISGNTDSITSFNYDKVWKINRFKVEEFRYMFALGAVTSGAYTVDSDILSWPAIGTGNITRNLAPFVDVNHDGIYNPLLNGDYPDIKGDQMCYWIFNDNLPHTETGGTPFKVEIHASAYAYVCADIIDSLKVLNYTTFYNYKIFNRSTEDYHKTYLGIWQDVDLGSANDDYVGCNPSLNYGSAFNGDSIDDLGPSGQLVYGLKPPMLSTVILNGPLAEPGDGIDNNNNIFIDELGEENLMTHFMYYNNDNTITGNPFDANHFYNYLHSTWNDSTHATYGGTGHLSGGSDYNFMFDGIPGDSTGWSEESTGNVPADRRFIMSCGPFNLNAGQDVSFDYAIAFTRDTINDYSSENIYQKSKEDIMKIQNWFALDSFPSCLLLNVGVMENQSVENEFSLFPNPSSNNITINYKPSSKNYSIKIYDATGRLVKSIDKINQEEYFIRIEDLSPGIYLLNLQDGDNSLTKRFIKQ